MTDASAPKENYSLFQEDIIERLKDVNFFIRCIGYNYRLLAGRWGCTCTVNARRIREAHSFWMADRKRALDNNMPASTKDLDHFKNSAFIAYWLRRTIPMNDVAKKPWQPNVRLDKDRMDQFMRLGNELGAILIGFQLCLFYEASKGVPHDGNVVPLHPDRAAYLRSRRFPSELLDDFSTVLKHKIVSPYSMYMMFRALFISLDQPEASAANTPSTGATQDGKPQR